MTQYTLVTTFEEQTLRLKSLDLYDQALATGSQYRAQDHWLSQVIKAVDEQNAVDVLLYLQSLHFTITRDPFCLGWFPYPGDASIKHLQQLCDESKNWETCPAYKSDACSHWFQHYMHDRNLSSEEVRIDWLDKMFYTPCHYDYY